MDTLLLQVGLSFVSALAAAGLSAWFSLRRFHSEKWLERKIQAYVSIIEALHNLKRDLDESVFRLSHTDLDFPKRIPRPNQMDNESGMAYRKSYAELMKLIDMGQVFLSSEANKQLEFLRGRLQRAGKLTDGALEYAEDIEMAISLTLDILKTQVRWDIAPGMEKIQ